MVDLESSAPAPLQALTLVDTAIAIFLWREVQRSQYGEHFSEGRNVLGRAAHFFSCITIPQFARMAIFHNG